MNSSLITETSNNRLTLCGIMESRDVLRYTPSGVPCLNFQILHTSQQMEAKLPRQIHLNLQAIALGEPALTLVYAPLPVNVRLSGFLAHRSHRSTHLVLHVQQVSFIQEQHQ